MAAFYAQYPSSSAATANASVGVNGSTAPTSSTEIAGINPSGNLQPVSVDALGNLAVAHPDTIGGGSITTAGQSIGVSTSSLGTVGVQITGTWVGLLVFEGSIDGTNYVGTTGVTLSTGVPVLGASANGIYQVQCSGLTSMRVRGSVVTSGTAVVTLRGNQSTAAIMLDNALPPGSNVIGHVIVDSSGLPTGASTSALQTTANASLASIDTKLTNPIPVTMSAVPTGGATAALQTTGNSSLSSINTKLAGSLVPVAFDEIDLTYVASGNGVGQIATAVYKLATVTVKTLTMTYDSSNRLTSTVAS